MKNYISFYERYILPIMMKASMDSNLFKQQRQMIIPYAQGNVLEIGIGSGSNLQYYDSNKVTKVWGLDPSNQALNHARKQALNTPFTTEFIEAKAENIPLENESMDTVLSTFTLCTVPEPATVLASIVKILKADGKFLFCEHGLAPDSKVRYWQNALNAANKKLVGGCNLNRPIAQLIEQNGFCFDHLQTQYFSHPKFLTFTYWGQCSKQV